MLFFPLLCLSLYYVNVISLCHILWYVLFIHCFLSLHYVLYYAEYYIIFIECIRTLNVSVIKSVIPKKRTQINSLIKYFYVLIILLYCLLN